MERITIPTLILFFTTLWVHGQPYPKDDFIAPLDVPLKLSGTFGELRSDHFHAGIDLKTGEMEGLKTYAIADGYVSRIKVQAGGYGKALYLTHPNGYVSVYAHLSRYNSILDDYVTRTQYSLRSYEIDLYPDAGMFPVKQGDVIAFTGNSGRSGGPHLHFEIREAGSQMPVNPLHFNFLVTDRTPPLINLLKVYPHGQGSRINGRNTAADLIAVSNGSVYNIKGNDTVTASGSVLFGINTYDPFNGGMNKNGVYSIDLFVDGELAYGHRLDRFSFDETRYINSLIDYREYRTKSRRVQRSFVDPNNRLSIYTQKNERGFAVEAGRRYQVRYVVSDFAGNSSELVFWLRGEERRDGTDDNGGGHDGHAFSFRKDNTFSAEGVSLMVPGRALYDTLTFIYSRKEKQPGSCSPMHGLHNDYVPLHSWCDLRIEPEVTDEINTDKLLIIKIYDDGDHTPCGGTFSGGVVSARIREFGDYCVVTDTVAPRISPVNISENKSLLAQHTIQVRIADDLSGIGTYNGYLNGEWVLMEYDAKNDLLTYHFDQHLQDGDNLFELVVTDERNNTATYRATLKY